MNLNDVVAEIAEYYAEAHVQAVIEEMQRIEQEAGLLSPANHPQYTFASPEYRAELRYQAEFKVRLMESVGAGPTRVGALRALTKADVGLAGTTARVFGKLSVRNGKATVKIDKLDKVFGTRVKAGPKCIIDAMKQTARDAGATRLRIETSPIIEQSGRVNRILGKLNFGQRNTGPRFLELEL